jgi:nondiscriminating glutamyl-tRNA synthetase
VKVRTRFAPSPTGYLHLGNARTAIFNWLFARHEGGTFILRIEDTDRERSRPEFEQGILRELDWLGLDRDEGIERGDHGPYRQSERVALGLYQPVLESLQGRHLVYPCFCSAERLEADREADRREGRMPMYSGRCRHVPADEARRRLEAGERAVRRFRVPEGAVVFEDRIRGRVEVDSRAIGDPILLRSDGWPTYNFAVVVDDLQMEISDVIRGEDHLSNTARQVLIYRALGATPPRFAHLPLVMGPDHAPLSKRHGDTSLRRFAEEGYLPEALLNCLALLGWSAEDGKEVLSREDLVRQFRLERVSKAAGVFDHAKLDFLGNQHLRRSAPARLAGLAAPVLQKAGLLPGDPPAAVTEWLARLMELLKDSLSRLEELPETDAVKILFDFSPETSFRGTEAERELREGAAAEVIRTFAQLLPKTPPLSPEDYRQAAAETGRRTGAKGRALYHPLRLALTGRASGPELVRIVPLIEEAAGLGLPRAVTDCRERCRRTLDFRGGVRE